ncbi:SDR family NAD(P)-dependent oxidoreductase [Maribacter litoralis]|uniref:SDR family NAD(P)-dependent oxidoreductase n=1 Tax=Maribacter litoralis TaxID=2059726 RepID=UPI003F5CDD26
MNYENKKILITGGSCGIGKALIGELYKRGAKEFAVVGRNFEKMEALQEAFPLAIFLCIQGDISQLNEIQKIYSRVNQVWGMLDMLINNAGVVSAGHLETINDDDIIEQQNINVTGLILLTKYMLPLLKESKEAMLINVSSGLGLIGLPFYAAYAATKAAVHQFSEALRRELKDFPIHVMTVYPTGTDTPMMKSANTAELDSPELVAQKTVEGMNNKEIEVILGGKQRIKDRKSNFENPLEFDKKVEKIYADLEARATGHRSM